MILRFALLSPVKTHSYGRTFLTTLSACYRLGKGPFFCRIPDALCPYLWVARKCTGEPTVHQPSSRTAYLRSYNTLHTIWKPIDVLTNTTLYQSIHPSINPAINPSVHQISFPVYVNIHFFLLYMYLLTPWKCILLFIQLSINQYFYRSLYHVYIH